MKKVFLLKLLKFLVISIFFVMILNNIVFAEGSTGFNVEGDFTGTIHNNATQSATKVQDVLITALTAVRVAGMGIAIIMLIMVGIKIMLASPSEKANIKQYSMNYVIGAFILFTASGIVYIVQSVAKSAFD